MAAAAIEAAAPKKGPSLVVQLAVLLVLTALAIGSGWFMGQFLHGGQAPEAQAAKPEEGKAKGKEGEAEKPVQDLHLFPLEPITTNLEDPADTWIRLELVLVFKEQPEPKIAEMVAQDLLAYLRTVKARQVDGASGFQHLKSDLDERAQIRSAGKIEQVLVKTMLFE